MFSWPPEGAVELFPAFAIAVEIIPAGSPDNELLDKSEDASLQWSRFLLGGHAGCLCFEVRPLDQLFGASDKVRSGLLPLLTRP